MSKDKPFNWNLLRDRCPKCKSYKIEKLNNYKTKWVFLEKVKRWELKELQQYICLNKECKHKWWNL